MSEIRVDPTTFGPAADRMDAAGNDLEARWEQLREKSLAVRFGEYDDIAPLIQMTLMAAVDIADECFTSARGAMDVISDGVRATGEIYAAAERDTADMVQQQEVPEGGHRWA